MQTNVLIVGGGLSGLALAESIARAGVSFHLVEARDRFGGRIDTYRTDDGYFDMGPAWFWPGQPRIAALTERFGLDRFEQHYEGVLSFEDEAGRVQRGRGYSSMQGSWRLVGGLKSLTEALMAALPEGSTRLCAEVKALSQGPDSIIAEFADGSQTSAQKVVLALPPRIAAENIAFSPTLPDTALNAMSNVATWMAGHAKVVALYDSPFWRAEGLSGDAMSRFGPMAEIHDASPADGASGALFGFIGVPPAARQDADAMKTAILSQLIRLFGPKAAKPKDLILKDWAFDPLTATQADQQPLFAHPQYGLPTALSGLMEERLFFAGTEVAPQFGGYLEGALEAAETAASVLGVTPTHTSAA